MDNLFKVPTEQTLLELGLITKERIRKYPLRLTNLNAVIKMYAINTNQPYILDVYHKKGISTEYYLTDSGLTYVYNFFNSKSFEYARSTFNYLFTNCTEEDYKHLDTFSFFDNFRGIRGVKTKAGSKQPALIIRKVNNTERKYNFDSIKEARDQLSIWLTQYPIEQFTLYRIKTKGKYKFKEQIKLIIDKPYNLKNYNDARRKDR